MSEAAFYPGDVSRLELNNRSFLAFDRTAQVQIGHSYNQVGTDVLMFGDDSAWA